LAKTEALNSGSWVDEAIQTALVVAVIDGARADDPDVAVRFAHLGRG